MATVLIIGASKGIDREGYADKDIEERIIRRSRTRLDAFIEQAPVSGQAASASRKSFFCPFE